MTVDSHELSWYGLQPIWPRRGSAMRTNKMAGINLMSDYCATGIWCNQSGVNLNYTDVPELDNDDIQEIERIVREYETADVDATVYNQEVEERSIRSMYEVGKKIKQKNPHLHVVFMNQLFDQPVVNLPIDEHGRSEITL